MTIYGLPQPLTYGTALSDHIAGATLQYRPNLKRPMNYDNFPTLFTGPPRDPSYELGCYIDLLRDRLAKEGGLQESSLRQALAREIPIREAPHTYGPITNTVDVTTVI